MAATANCNERGSYLRSVSWPGVACRMATRSRWAPCSAKKAHCPRQQLADRPALSSVVFVSNPQPVPQIGAVRQLLGAHYPAALVGNPQQRIPLKEGGHQWRSAAGWSGHGEIMPDWQHSSTNSA